MEPTDREVAFATNLELTAQRAGLQLDVGESQLVAIVIERAIATFDTGDKRAIVSLEKRSDEGETV